MAIVDNQKIMFKAGLQTAYNQMSSRDSGTFYVTTDTHRLYLGDNLLSQAVQFVSALPETNIDRGTIYYLTTANALAVYDGKSWVQLNPDTYIENVTFGVDTSGNTTNISLSISQLGGKVNTFTKKVTFAAGKNASITTSGNTITISGPSFGLTEDGINSNKAILASGSDSVEFVAGNNVTITPAAGGKITIASSYKDTTITGNSFTADIDAAGGFNYTSSLTDSAGKTISATKQTITPIIEYGTSKANAKFVSGKAILDVYTKAEVDAKNKETLNAVNAMTYKGTVGSGTSTLKGSTLPSTDVKIGDVYMSDQTGNITGTGITAGSYPAGTIFIATGTEANGIITPGTLKWNAVQTGANDTTYRFLRSGNTVTLKDSHDGTNGSITINAEVGGRVAVSVSNSDSDPVFTVSHTKTTVDTAAAAAKEQNAGANLTFKALTDIEVDAYGHITKAKMADITVKDTLAELKSATTTAASTAKTSAKVTTGFTLNNGVADSTKSTSFSLNSTTLAFSATGSAVTVDLAWGTF